MNSLSSETLYCEWEKKEVWGRGRVLRTLCSYELEWGRGVCSCNAVVCFVWGFFLLSLLDDALGSFYGFPRFVYSILHNKKVSLFYCDMHTCFDGSSPPKGWFDSQRVSHSFMGNVLLLRTTHNCFQTSHSGLSSEY